MFLLTFNKCFHEDPSQFSLLLVKIIDLVFEMNLDIKRLVKGFSQRTLALPPSTHIGLPLKFSLYLNNLIKIKSTQLFLCHPIQCYSKAFSVDSVSRLGILAM